MKMNFNKYLNIIIIIFITLIIIPNGIADAKVMETHDYRIQVNPEDVLMNKTYLMSRGEIKEENITITSDNTSLSLVVEIIHHHTDGRLWGLYVENSSTYWPAKEQESYGGFTKLMDHVSNYTVIHITKTPGEYVIGLHNSHLHEEPSTNFNLLVLNGHLGSETVIGTGTGTTDHTHNDTPVTSLPMISVLFSLVFIMLLMKRRNI